MRKSVFAAAARASAWIECLVQTAAARLMFGVSPTRRLQVLRVPVEARERLAARRTGRSR